MAKKGQPLQLQTEVNNDEEWDKLLQRDGLLIVDVYSEWCGPCSGMAATLKKIKLEIGGDLLQLAIAKADYVTPLKRFRNKSEPTWMFIVNGKLVNFMFGANAPKLIRLITDELKKEQDARDGKRQRVEQEICEPTEEELERLAVVENQVRRAKEKELAKVAKELYERRMAESEKILDTLQHFGVVLIFPHARTSYNEALGDRLNELGLTISQVEKQVHVTEVILEELFYFTPFHMEDIQHLQELIQKPSMAILIQKRNAESSPELQIDEIVAQVIYGKEAKPPGDEDCPFRKLCKKINEESELMGVWAPTNPSSKAMAIKWLFPKISEPVKLPDEKPTPLHVAVSYEFFKYKDVLELAKNKYPQDVLSFGFFTSDIVGEAQLIAKTADKFEERPDITFEEKLVIQLAKTNEECVAEFIELNPWYMSKDAVEGEKECAFFFPEGYNVPEEPVKQVKKKSKKRKAKKAVEETPDESSGNAVETEEQGGEETEADAEDEEDEDGVEEVDRATSPMNDSAQETNS